MLRKPIGRQSLSPLPPSLPSSLLPSLPPSLSPPGGSGAAQPSDECDAGGEDRSALLGGPGWLREGSHHTGNTVTPLTLVQHQDAPQGTCVG